MKLFFDFDHTLMQTDAFVELRLKRAFAASGVAILRPVWDRTLRAAIDAGYTPEHHAALLFDEGIKVSEIDLERIAASLIDISEFVFPDVVPFLRTQIDIGAEVWIVSYGAPSWQHFKIEHSKLGTFFPHERRIITNMHGTKADAIVEIVAPDEVFMFVDNKSLEVVTVAKQFPNSIPYLIDRTPANFVPNEGSDEHALWWETYHTTHTRRDFEPFPKNVTEISSLSEITT